MNNDYTNGFIIHSLSLPHITDLESRPLTACRVDALLIENALVLQRI